MFGDPKASRTSACVVKPTFRFNAMLPAVREPDAPTGAAEVEEEKNRKNIIAVPTDNILMTALTKLIILLTMDYVKFDHNRNETAPAPTPMVCSIQLRALPICCSNSGRSLTQRNLIVGLAAVRISALTWSRVWSSNMPAAR